MTFFFLSILHIVMASLLKIQQLIGYYEKEEYVV